MGRWITVSSCVFIGGGVGRFVNGWGIGGVVVVFNVVVFFVGCGGIVGISRASTGQSILVEHGRLLLLCAASCERW